MKILALVSLRLLFPSWKMNIIIRSRNENGFLKKTHIIYTHMQVRMCTHNPPRSDLRGPIIFDPLPKDGLLTLKDLCSESPQS